MGLIEGQIACAPAVVAESFAVAPRRVLDGPRDVFTKLPVREGCADLRFVVVAFGRGGIAGIEADTAAALGADWRWPEEAGFAWKSWDGLPRRERHFANCHSGGRAVR